MLLAAGHPGIVLGFSITNAERCRFSFPFLSWMQVNCNKCAITGMLYAQSSNDNVLSHGVVGMLQKRTAKFKIQGKSIPFQHPHNEPYRYLGIHITPTFNWGPHLARILGEAKAKSQRLLSCCLSKTQKMTMLITAIDPSITYSFGIGCMTVSDITSLTVQEAGHANSYMDCQFPQPQRWSTRTKTRQDLGCRSCALHTHK